MPTRSTVYQVRFPAQVIRLALRHFKKQLPRGARLASETLRVGKGADTWDLDSEAEFFAEYDTPVKRVSLHLDYYSAGTIYSFDLDLTTLFESVDTTVRIALRTRDQIDDMFRMFDEHLARNAANTPKGTPPPPPPVRVSMERHLPSCDIDQELLQELESLASSWATRAPDQSRPQPTQPTFTLVLKDATIHLPTSSELPRPYFPDDTRRVAMELGSTFRDGLTLTFDREREYSTLKVTLTAPTAKPEVDAIAAQVLGALRARRSSNWLFHPPSTLAVLLDLFSIFVISVALVFAFSGHGATALPIASGFLALQVYLRFKSLRPYSVFPTRRNETASKWTGWLLFATLEFILFTVIAQALL